ncbi:hypothetical protein [Pontimicrobium aquaticum]|uniref:Uncharacterized protein n=1 Tax=Pontimicrobium aquaticum TaxID=2565367 RepID=A0A4U0F220_9FLAO|nr:hypothetical protein [Pontimicrobium aquaticum]TJY37824.1 hypothetical protein E5167_00790 [Pontimicrobium aquaticum]
MQSKPFPNDEVNWPYGFKSIVRDSIFNGTIQFKNNPNKAAGMLFSPNLKKAIKAVNQIPIRIIIGANDTISLKSIKGVIGNTRIERGKNWSNVMNKLNPYNNQKIKIIIVNDIGHEPFKLLKAVHKGIGTIW